MKNWLLISIASGFIFTACNKPAAESSTVPSGETTKNDDHHDHEHGLNGGDLKNIGSAGVIEYLIDEQTATMKIFLYEKDGKTPLKVKEAPKVMAKLREVRISEPFTADELPNHAFTLTHKVFGSHVNVFVVVTLDGNPEPISVAFPHHH